MAEEELEMASIYSLPWSFSGKRNRAKRALARGTMGTKEFLFVLNGENTAHFHADGK